MSLSETTETVRAKIGADSGLAATLLFDLGADGAIHVNALDTPAVVTNEASPADCTLTMSLEDLDQMLAGTLDPMTAFMAGRIVVDGDMAVAMRLQQVVG